MGCWRVKLFVWGLLTAASLAGCGGGDTPPAASVRAFAQAPTLGVSPLAGAPAPQPAVRAQRATPALTQGTLIAWARQAYPLFFGGNSVTGTYAGYEYWYFPSYDNYIAFKDGSVFLLGEVSDWALMPVGSMEGFTCLVYDCGTSSGGTTPGDTTSGAGTSVGTSSGGSSSASFPLLSVNANWAAGHVIVVKKDHTMWGWGSNWGLPFGEDKTGNAMTSPVQVSGVNSQYDHVAVGDSRNLLYGTGLYLEGWGRNLVGELGTGTNKPVYAPVVLGYKSAVSVANSVGFTAIVDPQGALWYSGNFITATRTFKQVGTGYVAVAASESAVFALKNDGSLWTFGTRNTYGELGRPAASADDMHTPVQIMSDVAQVVGGQRSGYAIRKDGTLWVWGANDHGQLGDGTTVQRNTPVQAQVGGFATVAAGADHTLGLMPDGSLYAWGGNAWGQLGDGGTTDSPTPTKVATGVAAAAAGVLTSFAADTSGSIYSAGLASEGMLGNGSNAREAVTSFTKNLFDPGGSGGTGTGGTGGGGTSGGGSGGSGGSGAEAACAAKPYTGSTADPQAYTWDYIAQFDQCAYRATGNTAYITDGDMQCKVLDGMRSYWMNGFRPQYCNGPKLIL